MRSTENIDDVASELGFELDRSDLDVSRRVAEGLADAAETVRSQPQIEDTFGEASSMQLNDEYGSLLAGYEEPRFNTSDGPLAGLEVVLKDNTAVAGLPMTCGADNFEYTPDFDASVVNRLLDAGARIVGKSNMDAFAFGPSGEFSERKTVVNPIEEDRIPGGSSSGSGVAVAAGLVDFALGTDTGGSVRIPAAANGIVGVKPTFGTVSTHGVVPFAPSLDTVGPLTKDVRTARKVLHILQRDDSDKPENEPQSEQSLPNTPKIGIITQLRDASSNTVKSALNHVLNDIEDSLNLIEVSIPTGSIEQAYSLVGSTEFAWYIRQRGTIRGAGSTYNRGWAEKLNQYIDNGRFSDHIAKRVLPAAFLDANEGGHPYIAGRTEAQRFGRAVDDALNEVDALLAPTLRTLPHNRGEISADKGKFDLLGNTAPFNLTGHPAISLPIAKKNGLPVSVQIIVPRYRDDLALAIAELIEDLVGDSR